MIVDSLQSGWNSLLDFLTKLVVPDWGSLVNLLPIFLVIGVLGPAITIGMLLWLYYFVSKPRTGVTYDDDGPHPARVDADGRPIFPVGEPYCSRHARVFPSGATRCDIDDQLLAVVCPKCGSGRAAEITTCGNCGLVLKIAPRARVLRPSGPPPGGAAAA